MKERSRYSGKTKHEGFERKGGQMEKDRMILISKIIDRACTMGLTDDSGSVITDRTGVMMDIDSADQKFNLRLEEWLNADKFEFTHDFYGIEDNIVRDKFPATDFGHFVPRFAGA